MLKRLILVALCALAPAGALADENCSLLRIASVDMTFAGSGRPVVPMSANGQKLNMLVDTGGFLTLLHQSGVTRLGLNSLPMNPDLRGRMFGGQVIDHYTVAQQVDLGGLKAQNFRFAIMQAGESEIDGTIGPDILSQYDVEFDFANAKLNLFSRNHCPGKVVYWTRDPYSDIDMRFDEVTHLFVPVDLDGHHMQALIDTGSYRSVMSLETAESMFSIPASRADLKVAEGARPTHRSYPFKTLTLQGVSVTAPDIVLVPDEESHVMRYGGAPKLILGMGILRQLHLYIAYREKKLYVTPASAH